MAKGENPAQRSARYARELKSGKNEFTGKPLTKGQCNFRGGVLNERKWGASIFKHKKANAAANGKSTNTSKKTTTPKDGKTTSKSKTTTPKKNGNINWQNFRSPDFDYDGNGNISGHCIGGNLNNFEPD